MWKAHRDHLTLAPYWKKDESDARERQHLEQSPEVCRCLGRHSIWSPGPLIFSPVPPYDPGVGNGNLLQCSCLENSMDRRGLASCSPWGCEELDTVVHISTPFTIWATSARTQQFPCDTWLSCLEVSSESSKHGSRS